MLARAIGWLLGQEQVAEVSRPRLAWGAEWAAGPSGSFWLCLGSLAVVVLVGLFYLRNQWRGSRRVRSLLAVSRSLLLLLVLATLARPVLHVTVARWELPELWVVFDGTASMQLRDQYDPRQQMALTSATGLPTGSSEAPNGPTRQDYVRAWLTREAESAQSLPLLAALDAAPRCRLRFFLFDGQRDSRLRELTTARKPDGSIAWQKLADQLTQGGEVTALGTVLRDLARLAAARPIGGVVLVSDFGHNAGESPLGDVTSGMASPIESLRVPVIAMGVGAARNRDLAVDLQPEPTIRLGEKTQVVVNLRQTELDGAATRLRLTARLLREEPGTTPPVEIESRQITLQGPNQKLEFAYTPQQAGAVELLVEASPLTDEVSWENNAATHRVDVLDDFVRLLYVAHEPTWEWRFLKEMFQRDPAVGMRGFRTYLAASDPRVRESNPLFLPTLNQQPAEFYLTDVVFLDDVPARVLTPEFCSMLERFVRELGGGLVVMAGPRFGPRQLAETPLATMLPVLLDPQAKLQDHQEFVLQLTARASEFAFMRLEEDPADNQRVWSNQQRLPWYQPVAQVHERGTVLARHPRDRCHDGTTYQPLIAVRRYGSGEVVYLGYNETWRLRRQYGETYHRRFWLPLLDRLALSHPLGAGKRFVVRMNRTEYGVRDEARVSVQAYDAQFEPLDALRLAGESLEAEVLRVAPSGREETVDTVRLGASGSGLFETGFPVRAAGRYRLRVRDPVTQSFVQRDFTVSDVSLEARSSVRNARLQQQLAAQSQGISCVLEEADRLPDQLRLTPVRETADYSYALWTSPLWFALVILLMTVEWFARKWFHLE